MIPPGTDYIRLHVGRRDSYSYLSAILIEYGSEDEKYAEKRKIKNCVDKLTNDKVSAEKIKQVVTVAQREGAKEKS